MRNLAATVLALALHATASAETVYRGSAEPVTPYPPTTISVPGSQAIDPTANVQKLVEAAIKRLDDLRIADARRLEDLQSSNDRRVSEIAALRADFAEKLAIAEAKRIDAIRAIDVNAVSIATERATQQANVLAAQVTQSAETLRNLVASSAQTLAAQQDVVAKQFEARLSQLEKSQYTNQGQNQPGLSAQMLDRLTSLEKSQNEISGKGAGLSAMWGYVAGAMGIAIAVFGVFFGRQRPSSTL